MRPSRPAGLDLGLRFSLIVMAFNQNLKAKTYNEQLKHAEARTGTIAAITATNAP